MKINNLGANKTEIETDLYIVFFSYKTPVAYNAKDGSGFFRTSKKWSVTTSKHINQWLDGAKAKEVEQSVLDNLL